MQTGRGFGRSNLPAITTRVMKRVETGKPLNFSVVALAHKNPQFNVCGGSTQPDLAELGFLLHLQEIIEGVERHYSGGATVTVLTEGGFYQQKGIFDVDREEIDDYELQMSSLAEIVGCGKIELIPLHKIVEGSDVFEEEFARISASIRDDEVAKFLPVMERSITDTQVDIGITPQSMALKYASLHRAKTGVLNQYLSEQLGENFIYCSITDSGNSDKLRIDVFDRPAPPPQHGIGVLHGGTAKIEVVSFAELKERAENINFGAIKCDDIGESPFGIISFGGKKK